MLSADRSTQVLVETSLAPYGYDVALATTHEQVFRELRDRRVRIVVADLDSDRAERLSLVRAARLACPTVPIIYTALHPWDVPAHEKVAGAPCLRSPYHPHQLLNLVRQFLRWGTQEEVDHAA
jgi:DNA-binding response OmpR family regulator